MRWYAVCYALMDLNRKWNHVRILTKFTVDCMDMIVPRYMCAGDKMGKVELVSWSTGVFHVHPEILSPGER